MAAFATRTRARIRRSIHRRATLIGRSLATLPGTVRDHPGRAAAAAGAFVFRWLLRIGLPIAGAATMLTLFPKYVDAGGVRFRVQGSLLHDSGVSADTSVGNWEFPHVSALPVGVHVSPENLDLVKLAGRVGPDPAGYADRLRGEFAGQLPAVFAWLIGEALIGVGLGLLVAMAINLAVRQLRGLPRRPHEPRRRLRQLATATAAVAVVALVGALTYNPGWPRSSRLTGTLAALQLFPGELEGFYDEHAKIGDVLSAVGAIQAGLQANIDANQIAPTAFDIMFISDMHLASTYPLVAQYARAFGVSLIVDTGDDAEFGISAELTPAYLAQMRAVTQVAPMLWLAGNHDSPETVKIMRSVPGVTVLGTKTADGSGGYTVTGQQVQAYGLTIAGIPDPRVYGGAGAYGSNDPSVVEPLEQATVRAALTGTPDTATFDILATHEPSAMDEAERLLGDRVRQLNGGHVHAQNPDAQIQRPGRPIFLVEGSTGGGGLDNLNSATIPPIEFSVESVAGNCQFTKIVRFQVSPSAITQPGTLPQVTSTTHYFTPQRIGTQRRCTTALGLGSPEPLGS